MSHVAICIVLVLTSCSCVWQTQAYRHGDSIPVLKRSQYQGYRTEWSDLLSKDTPRFGITRYVYLPLAPLSKVRHRSLFRVCRSLCARGSVGLWVCGSVCLCVCVSVHACPPSCVRVFLYACMPECLWICGPVGLCVSLPLCLSASLLLCFSASLFLCLSVVHANFCPNITAVSPILF
jgi:hypothetical protein